MTILSSRLLALTNPFRHGLVHVHLHGFDDSAVLTPHRTDVVFSGGYCIDAARRRLVMFMYVQDGEVHTVPVDFAGEYHEHVQLAIMYFGDPSVRSLIDGMLGPLRTWDDIEAADALIEAMVRPMATGGSVG